MAYGMELKEIILETISSLEQHEISALGTQKQEFDPTDTEAMEPKPSARKPLNSLSPSVLSVINEQTHTYGLLDDEISFLSLLEERLLVLFEGLNQPQNSQDSKKLQMVLNFLQYQLSVIARRLEILSK